MRLDRPALRRTLDVHGPRPADDVWDRYVRPRRWPEWSPQIRSVDYPAETLRGGTGGVVHGVGGLRVDFEILEVDAEAAVRSWTWTVSAAGVRMWLRHTVEATGAGSRTGLTVSGFAPAVLLYLPAAAWALYRLVR